MCEKKNSEYSMLSIYTKKNISARIMPVILATWEAKIERIAIQDQSRQIVLKTPSPKITRKMNCSSG
jgi:hypothetical protein